MNLKFISPVITGLLLFLLTSSIYGQSQTLTQRYENTFEKVLSIKQNTSTSRSAECTDPLMTITRKYEKELKDMKTISSNIASCKTPEIISELLTSIEVIDNTYTELETNPKDSTDIILNINLTANALSSLSIDFKNISRMGDDLLRFYTRKRDEITRSTVQLIRIEKELENIETCLSNEINTLSLGEQSNNVSVTITRLEKEKSIIEELNSSVRELQQINNSLLSSTEVLQKNVSEFMHIMTEVSQLFNTASIAYRAINIAEANFEEISDNIESITGLSNALSDISAEILDIADSI